MKSFPLISLYLEFIRNISGVMTLLMISSFAYLLVEYYSKQLEYPQALQIFSFVMIGISTITMLFNYINFNHGLNKLEVSSFSKWVMRIFILVLGTFIYCSLIYLIVFQATNLLSNFE